MASLDAPELLGTPPHRTVFLFANNDKEYVSTWTPENAQPLGTYIPWHVVADNMLLPRTICLWSVTPILQTVLDIDLLKAYKNSEDSK